MSERQTGVVVCRNHAGGVASVVRATLTLFCDWFFVKRAQDGQCARGNDVCLLELGQHANTQVSVLDGGLTR